MFASVATIVLDSVVTPPWQIESKANWGTVSGLVVQTDQAVGHIWLAGTVLSLGLGLALALGGGVGLVAWLLTFSLVLPLTLAFALRLASKGRKGEQTENH